MTLILTNCDVWRFIVGHFLYFWNMYVSVSFTCVSGCSLKEEERRKLCFISYFFSFVEFAFIHFIFIYGVSVKQPVVLRLALVWDTQWLWDLFARAWACAKFWLSCTYTLKLDVKTTVKHCGKQNRIQRTCECKHGARVCVCVNKILEHCCRCCNVTGKLCIVISKL